MELSTGQQVDRYAIEARLGSGGIATVYRVRHTELGTTHALKMLQLVQPDLVARLRREGQLLGSLTHRNVLGVTDWIDVDGRPGLVLELVRGWTLADLLEAGGLTRNQIDWLARGILEGVAAAHEVGLVHRDLKPANILVAWEDDAPVPKVADFGLARAVDAETLATRLTRGVLGTPGYMAPEQVMDAAAADHRADVFSLGCVLYELVTGKRAFEGAHVYEVLEHVRRGQVVAPSQIADVPPEWEQAILGALAPDPSQRTADVRALIEAWERGPTGDPGPWDLPPVPEAAPLSTDLPDLHPDLDTLLEHPDRADVVAHLEGCPECRLDVRLYTEVFGDVGRPPWQIGAVAGVAAAPLVLGVLAAVFGDLRTSAGGGAFAGLLVVAGSVCAAWSATQWVRYRRGAVVTGWEAPASLPATVGAVGSVAGLWMMRGALAASPSQERFELGTRLALQVEWAGWVLAAMALLAVSLGRSWADHRWDGRAAAATAGIGGALWLVAIGTAIDGPATYVVWAVAVAAASTRSLAGALALICVARVGFLDAARADPSTFAALDAGLALVWMGVAVALTRERPGRWTAVWLPAIGLALGTEAILAVLRG